MDACVRKVFTPVVLFDAERSASQAFIHELYKRVEERMDYNSKVWSEYGKPDTQVDIAVSPSSSTSSAFTVVPPPTWMRERSSPGPGVHQARPETRHTAHTSVSRPRRSRNNLPKHTTDFLKDWLEQHKRYPYPTEEEKCYLASMTGLQLPQISNWFINARRRHLPRDSSSIRRIRAHHPTRGKPTQPLVMVY